MEHPVTMKDVARALGVSTATVSLGLRNRPNISAALRAQIVSTAETLGYRPNPHVSALMRSRRNRGRAQGLVIALVHGLATKNGWRDSPSPTLRGIRQGALERARGLGYSTEEFSLDPDEKSTRRLSRILTARGVRGILLGPRVDGVPPPTLEWKRLAAIGIGLPDPTLPLHMVSNDHYFSALRIMEECHRLGYRRPGLILRESHRQKFQGRWEAGYRSAQEKFPALAKLSPLFLANPESYEAFATAPFRKWFESENPDAILALAPEYIEAGLKLLRPAPPLIGLASLSCPHPGARHSGIFPNGPLIGATAIELLASRIERNDLGLPAQGMATMIEGLWNPGETLRAKA
jgi:DNA-binding LacI/PurR family transcriptional regulator